ncbi:hypothetical protein [Spirabiliibacterium mucosae]
MNVSQLNELKMRVTTAALV